MSAKIINGKETAARTLEQVQKRAEAFRQSSGRPPGLATVVVGNNPASAAYVRQKIKACESRGFASFHKSLPEGTTQEDLEKIIDSLNKDARVDGIIVQLPLPAKLDPDRVIHQLDPRKDVDGLHPLNQGLLARMKDWNEIQSSKVPLSCTPAGIMELLSHYRIDPSGKEAVVIGRSTLVGKPLAQLLLSQNATVTIAHSKTPNLPEVCRRADIVVAAIGKPRFIVPEMVRPGAVVIDVGISRTESGLVGDVDFDQVKEVAGWITPVPGGVGPMTVAMLLKNTVAAAERER